MSSSNILHTICTNRQHKTQTHFPNQTKPPKVGEKGNREVLKIEEVFPLPSKPNRTIAIAATRPCPNCHHERGLLILHSPGRLFIRSGGCDTPLYQLGLKRAISLDEAWEEVKRSREKLEEWFEVRSLDRAPDIPLKKPRIGKTKYTRMGGVA